MTMSMNKKVLALLLFASVGFFSCNKEDDLGSSNIKIAEPQRQGLDKWIYDNYVIPLNIEVKYKWDDSELALDKKLVPPYQDRIEPFLQVVKSVWAEPYADLAIVPDPAFLKMLSPKQIVLVGSMSYNADGSVTLGTAEGGRKIVLYDVNNFDKKAKFRVIRMLYTMQHEFAHILHQNKMYTPEFKKITPNYTTTWMNYADNESNDAGFITSYARSSSDEDFAEMIAAMLTKSKVEFDAFVNSIESVEGQKSIRKKEAIIVTYYRERYGINIYSLQQRVVMAMVAVMKAPSAASN